MDEPAAKIANRKRDLERWTAKYDLAFRFPDRFPIKTSRALRGAIAMRRWDRERAFVDAIFQRYWEANDASIAEYEGLRAVAARLSVDGDEFEAVCESAETRDALAESTNEGLARGIFGAPSFVVGGEIFWGKDRMDFIEDALARSG